VQNPDVIERDLRHTRQLDFTPWGLSVEPSELAQFFAAHPLAADHGIHAPPVRNNLLTLDDAGNPYLVTVLADFMRRKWLAGHISFTCETVMSGPDKVGLLRNARRLGYRTYLYFVCTDSPLINQGRVAARVADGGHNIPDDKIVQRYGRSLRALREAVAVVNRAYLFDNSTAGHPARLIAEYQEGALLRVTEDLPNWYVTTLLRPLAHD
jgi:predicted ABC-type ATPase